MACATWNCRGTGRRILNTCAECGDIFWTIASLVHRLASRDRGIWGRFRVDSDDLWDFENSQSAEERCGKWNCFHPDKCRIRGEHCDSNSNFGKLSSLNDHFADLSRKFGKSNESPVFALQSGTVQIS